MNILGIESSCDETAAAVVTGYQVKSSVVSSQIAVHAPFGGVIPELAARKHLEAIGPVVDQALDQARLTLAQIDAIAVTQGPGLVGALLVGISYAKGLALALNKPLIPVNHVHAHVHGALCDQDVKVDDLSLYPALALVVSGGHTNIYFMRGPTQFELVGYSVDDACGESFDKVAKLLGMSYPGGVAIEKLAKQGDGTKVPMPRMMSEKARLQFSYSGLKTHMVNLSEKVRRGTADFAAADLCAAFQEEALGQINRKLTAALALYPQSKSLIIAGGVSANQRFRALLSGLGTKVQIFWPRLQYCSDNAAMIAALGGLLAHEQGTQAKNFHDMTWDAYARYE